MADPTPTATPEPPPPGAYVPSTEKPHVIPPIPHAYPASSAPLPEGVEIKKTTASVSAPSESVAPPPVPPSPPPPPPPTV